jgi:phospholipid/cholesterol/gamma-HCH transport system permease protein
MTQPSLLSKPGRLGHKLLAWLRSWWQIALFGAVVLTLALTPTTYTRACRSAVARQIVRATTVNLLWFCVLSALISVVLVRIVVVTAISYGLSRFAIEMVVRVLVLELIPLTAAMFVALRYSLPDGAALEQMREQGQFDALRQGGADPIAQEFFPRVLASVFSVWMLGAVSCIMTLVLAYLAVYGFTPWAVAGYTRVVGQVFNPAVALILVLKILFFSLAVSFIPMASAYYDGASALTGQSRLASGLAGMVRLFAVVLLIEVASLMGNYY